MGRPKHSASRRFTSHLRELLRSLGTEEGQTLAEYVMVLTLVAIVVAGALFFLQGKLSGMYSLIESAL